MTIVLWQQICDVISPYALTPPMSYLHRVKISELCSTNPGVYDGHLATIFRRQMGDIEKSPYLSNDLTDRHKIWHGDTLWHYWPFPPLKFPHFENQRWRRPPSWKIEKSSYLSNGVNDQPEIWHGDAFWPSRSSSSLKCPHIENPTWRRPPCWKIKKIVIFQQRFDRSPRNLAWWRILILSTLSADKIPTF